MRYSPEEFKGMLTLRTQILRECPECKGSGVGKDDAECSCMTVFGWVKELTHACIPREYWRMSLSNIKTDTVAKMLVTGYLKNFDNALKQGLGFVFLGPLGIGKTSLMCVIGKYAIAESIPTYYTTVQKYVDSSYNKGEVDQRVADARVLLLDELDKVYIKDGSTWVRKRLEELLRHSIPHHKIVLVGTNYDEEEVTQAFGPSVTSLVQGHLKYVNFAGQDHRKQMQKDWLARLKGSSPTFFDPTIVKEAKHFQERQAARRAAQYDETW